MCRNHFRALRGNRDLSRHRPVFIRTIHPGNRALTHFVRQPLLITHSGSPPVPVRTQTGHDVHQEARFCGNKAEDSAFAPKPHGQNQVDADHDGVENIESDHIVEVDEYLVADAREVSDEDNNQKRDAFPVGIFGYVKTVYGEWPGGSEAQQHNRFKKLCFHLG
jgi:hypothetical protein